ncbi:hypothetical protein CTA1_10081 [Colletotrichum tanaceti]|uniref:Uncharacterized protein n=1 Tax=Colletotrichum tanaceti TaxID=1306861 RepID=A0A4V6DG83_9PEZI|nr:hypothetical protein CTA1_10081 [Colletotrichum tanaceti]
MEAPEPAVLGVAKGQDDGVEGRVQDGGMDHEHVVGVSTGPPGATRQRHDARRFSQLPPQAGQGLEGAGVAVADILQGGVGELGVDVDHVGLGACRGGQRVGRWLAEEDGDVAAGHELEVVLRPDASLVREARRDGAGLLAVDAADDGPDLDARVLLVVAKYQRLMDGQVADLHQPHGRGGGGVVCCHQERDRLQGGDGIRRGREDGLALDAVVMEPGEIVGAQDCLPRHLLRRALGLPVAEKRVSRLASCAQVPRQGGLVPVALGVIPLVGGQIREEPVRLGRAEVGAGAGAGVRSGAGAGSGAGSGARVGVGAAQHGGFVLVKVDPEIVDVRPDVADGRGHTLDCGGVALEQSRVRHVPLALLLLLVPERVENGALESRVRADLDGGVKRPKQLHGLFHGLHEEDGRQQVVDPVRGIDARRRLVQRRLVGVDAGYPSTSRLGGGGGGGRTISSSSSSKRPHGVQIRLRTRSHVVGVICLVHAQTTHKLVLVFEDVHHVHNGGLVARDGDARGRVARGHLDSAQEVLVVAERLGVLQRGPDSQHGALLDAIQATAGQPRVKAAIVRNADGVLSRQESGSKRGPDLARGMSNHGGEADAAVAEKLHEDDLDNGAERLRNRGVADLARGCVSKQLLSQGPRRPVLLRQPGQGAVHGVQQVGCVRGRLDQLGTHASPLRALAGEDSQQTGLLGAVAGGLGLELEVAVAEDPRQTCLERRNGRCGQGEPERKTRAAGLQSPRKVGRTRVRMLFQVLRIGRDAGEKRLFGLRREEKGVDICWRGLLALVVVMLVVGMLGWRKALQDDVRVGPAEPEAVHAGAPALSRQDRRPRGELLRDLEVLVVGQHVRVEVLQKHVGRHVAVLHGLDDLQDACQAGGALCMADDGLDRPDEEAV